MPQTPDTAALTLAGLASANGPWLATRLLRLMEVSGLAVPGEVAQLAVDAASRLLIETLGAEGRPDMSAAWVGCNLCKSPSACIYWT